MHRHVQKESHARRKGDGKQTDSEDTEPEEEPRGEMNNFQDLQLGSTMPVVRHEALQLILASSSNHFSAGYGPTFRILTPDSTPPAHTRQCNDNLKVYRSCNSSIYMTFIPHGRSLV